VRATSRVFVYLLTCHGRQQVAKLRRERILDLVIIFVRLCGGGGMGGQYDGRGQADLSHRGDKGDDLDVMSLFEILLSYGAGGNTA
jgi:hypothetical protein